ncbi:hypothetical protein MT418_003056 [Batrachochytrium dendrobatidis]
MHTPTASASKQASLDETSTFINMDAVASAHDTVDTQCRDEQWPATKSIQPISEAVSMPTNENIESSFVNMAPVSPQAYLCQPSCTSSTLDAILISPVCADTVRTHDTVSLEPNANDIQSVDIDPPSYSPSNEDPPPYPTKNNSNSKSHALAVLKRLSLVLIAVDLIFAFALAAISGVMILYSGTNSTFVIVIPVMYAIFACFGRAGLIYKNGLASLFYITTLILRWLCDTLVLMYMTMSFNGDPFFMSVFGFVLTFPISGVRGIQTMLMPCFDQYHFNLTSGECADFIFWDEKPLNFGYILIAMLFPHFLTIVVHALNLYMMEKEKRNLQLQQRLDSAERAVIATASLYALRLSQNSETITQPRPNNQFQPPQQLNMHRCDRNTPQVYISPRQSSRSYAFSTHVPIRDHPHVSRGQGLIPPRTASLAASRSTRSSIPQPLIVLNNNNTPTIDMHERNRTTYSMPTRIVFPRGTLLGELDARQQHTTPKVSIRH